MVLKKKHKTKEQKTNTVSNPKIIGYYYIIMFLIFIILDRITKIWALTLKEKPITFHILEFTYITNTGAGFNILNNQNTLLIWIAIIALGTIIYYNSHFPKLAFVMIVAGIIGNLIDRIIYGYVIDMINLKFWPVFNISDSLIFLGVVYTIIFWFKNSKNPARKRLKTKKGSKTNSK
ncbi:MAG: signal peptidase II [Candidatus Woesearchaeota archaeon]